MESSWIYFGAVVATQSFFDQSVQVVISDFCFCRTLVTVFETG